MHRKIYCTYICFLDFSVARSSGNMQKMFKREGKKRLCNCGMCFILSMRNLHPQLYIWISIYVQCTYIHICLYTIRTVYSRSKIES